MRRKDREITDSAEIIEIIRKCEVCRLGLSRDNQPYVVPVNFGFEYTDGKLTLYFHCAHAGMKLDFIDGNPRACFEMDCSHRLITDDCACEFTMEYESVIGFGEIRRIIDPAEKETGLRVLMKQYSGDSGHSFTTAQVASVTVLRLDADQFTGKRHIGK